MGASQVLGVSPGVSPHLLFQSAHEGRACLLGECPPLSFGMGSCPILSSLSLHVVLWGSTLLGGSPCGVGWILPPPRPCMPCARSARCSGGAPSLASCLRGIPSFRLVMPCAGSTRCSGGAPSLSSCIRGIPSSRLGMSCAGSARCHMGGYPPSPWLCSRTVGERGLSPPPSCLLAVYVRGLGG